MRVTHWTGWYLHEQYSAPQRMYTWSAPNTILVYSSLVCMVLSALRHCFEEGYFVTSGHTRYARASNASHIPVYLSLVFNAGTTHAPHLVKVAHFCVIRPDRWPRLLWQDVALRALGTVTDVTKSKSLGTASCQHYYAGHYWHDQKYANPTSHVGRKEVAELSIETMVHERHQPSFSQSNQERPYPHSICTLKKKKTVYGSIMIGGPVIE